MASFKKQKQPPPFLKMKTIKETFLMQNGSNLTFQRNLRIRRLDSLPPPFTLMKLRGTLKPELHFLGGVEISRMLGNR